jgi:hypothetical protein
MYKRRRVTCRLVRTAGVTTKVQAHTSVVNAAYVYTEPDVTECRKLYETM